MSRFLRIATFAASVALVGIAASARPAHAQASGTLQATVTVLAAAQPLDLQLAHAESPSDEPRLLAKSRHELAEVDIEKISDASTQAAHPRVRVTVTYLR